MKRLLSARINCNYRGARLFSAQPPSTSNTLCPSKAPTNPCTHSSETKALALLEGKVERNLVPKGYELPAENKKCPVFCSYGDKQCPPLVPPVVRPKARPTPTTHGKPESPREVPTAALFAYRVLVFGAKVGVGAYCIKWTIDNHIWGHSSDTRALWDQWKRSAESALPALSTLSGSSVDPCSRTSVAQVWNSGVILAFDKAQEAARTLRRFAVDKERAAYGLTDADTLPTNADSVEESFWQSLLRNWFHENKGVTPPPESAALRSPVPEKDDPAFVETVAPGECHLAIVITDPGNQDLHRNDGKPLPEEPVPALPPAPEVEELDEFEKVVKKVLREEGSVRMYCCQVHQMPPELQTLVETEPCGKPGCTVCPSFVVTRDE